MRVWFLITCISLFNLVCPFIALGNTNTPSINWYTEDYPPFNYLEEEEIKGIAIKILKATYQQLDWPLAEHTISLTPWARVYRTLQKDANACVFSIAYTEERAKLFNFIGPVMPITVAIIGHASSSINEVQLKTDSTLRYGVVKNDIGHQLLKQYGIPEAQFVYLKTGFELVKMIEQNRVDLIAYGDIIARYQFTRANINPVNFKIIKPLLNSTLGFACNKKVPQNIVMTLDQTIRQVVEQNPLIIQNH